MKKRKAEGSLENDLQRSASKSELKRDSQVDKSNRSNERDTMKKPSFKKSLKHITPNLDQD